MAFYTSADALTVLKQAGVPDMVILAMVEAGAKPAQPIPATTQPAELSEVKVSDGQQFEIELARTASRSSIGAHRRGPRSRPRSARATGATRASWNGR